MLVWGSVARNSIKWTCTLVNECCSIIFSTVRARVRLNFPKAAILCEDQAGIPSMSDKVFGVFLLAETRDHGFQIPSTVGVFQVETWYFPSKIPRKVLMSNVVPPESPFVIMSRKATCFGKD